MARTSTTEVSNTRSTVHPAFSALVGLTSLVVLFQAVWAGMFIREGMDFNSTWVAVHSRGAELAIVLALIAAVLAFIKFRERRDLLIGTIAFPALLILESYLGGIIGNSPSAEVLHFPSLWRFWASPCGCRCARAAERRGNDRVDRDGYGTCPISVNGSVPVPCRWGLVTGNEVKALQRRLTTTR